MADEKLMTVEEFNNRVTKWTLVIKQKSKRTLSSNTDSSGRLALNIEKFVDKLSDHDPAYKVKFNFFRYGVYRAYGVGRGYICINGVVMRGYRVRSDREIKRKEFGTTAGEMLKRGYLVRDINTAKRVDVDELHIARKSLDWIDQHIEAGIDELADTVQEFYGDEALKQMLGNFHKLQIKKK